MARIIRVCAGIGDNIWLLQKLVNTGEKFHFHIAGGAPQRGLQIFELMPQVTQSARYVKGLTYNILKRGNTQKFFPVWKIITGRRIEHMMLSCNEWLEEGKPLKDYFPDLPISYRLDYQTSEDDKKTAIEFTPLHKNYIGIYCSAYSTQRAWGFWDEDGWFDLITHINKDYKNKTFIIIGAEWDIDLTSKLIDKLQTAGISYRSTVGQPLGVVVEILKRLDYFIGFPSGLSILNETLGKNGLMFYPPHLEKMINTWADPERIESEDYKGMLFCSTEEAYKWIKNSKKIQNG